VLTRSDLATWPASTSCANIPAACTALVKAGAALAVATAFSPTVSIGYNPSPGWPDEWRIIQRHLARLREQYQGKRMEGNEDVEENVHARFLALSHLYDWLYQDSSTSLTSQVVKAWIDSHPNSLAICRDYANTFKHMKRQSANAITAQITRIESGPSGQTVAIGYRPSGQSNAAMTEVDGLDLAERSEQDWRGLLSLYGIAIPR
jgi:hypothetical protein